MKIFKMEYFNKKDIADSIEMKFGIFFYAITIICFFLDSSTILCKIIASVLLTMFISIPCFIYKKEKGYYPWDKNAP